MDGNTNVEESARIASLHRLRILDTPPEERFDRITRVAARLFDVPIALISLVDENRQWFKSCVGLDTRETPLGVSFCAQAIRSDDILLIPDAQHDPRFAANPLVTGPPFVRFYAGYPLTAPDGHKLGTLCIIDRRPRQFSATDIQALRDLGAWAQLEISQIQTLRQELQHSEDKYRLLVEQTSDGIVLVDAAGNIFEASQTAHRMFGYNREELLRLNVADVMSPEDVRATLPDLAQMRDGATLRCEHIARHRDGSTFPVEVSYLLIEAGSVQAIVRDISERKRTEEALRAALRQTIRFAAAIDNLSAGVIITGTAETDYTIQFANPAFTKLTGYTQAEIVGQNCRFLQGPQTDRAEVAKIRQAIDGQQPYDGVLLDYRKDGTPFWNELTISPVFDANGQLINFVGVQSDVTERIRGEAALHSARETADAANKAKSEFLSRMSHELRTPLHAILGFAQLLAAENLPPEHLESLSYIIKGGRQLLELINETLDLARIEAGRLDLTLEPVAVGPLLIECLELVRPLVDKAGLQLWAANLQQCDALIMADGQRLKQVLLNLLTNAIKYNRPGGSIIASCDEDTSTRLRIEVRDTGVGIADDQAALLFTPFERIGAERSPVEGTGLGLAISRRLIEAMDGTIGMVSRPGEGSTFWLDLPLVVLDTHEPYDEPDAGNAADLFASGRAGRLLYIEDNAANRQLIEHVIARYSRLELVAAGDGRTGLELARHEQLDLILLDLNLPDIAGEEVLRRLKSDPVGRRIPVVVLSADASPSRVEALLAAGAYSYLTKPLDIDKFQRLLQEVMA